MPHVTFIHGISNKPEQDTLLELWENALARNGGLDLGADGVTTEMVYWADVMYEHPDPLQGAHESNDSVIMRKDVDIDMTWLEGASDAEKAFTQALQDKLGVDFDADDEFEPPESEMTAQLERIPLPGWLKKRLMKALLRDVHHYLYNAEHSPREGTRYKVQDEIRQRFVEAMKRGNGLAGGTPHVVVSHSMGTVIAYDCLKRDPTCPAADALMTVGSPLGLDEVQDGLVPGYEKATGFPSDQQLRQGIWVNVYDPLDIIAALDPKLANDYQRNGNPAVDDVSESNWGKWRHNISHYLAQPELRRHLGQLLGR